MNRNISFLVRNLRSNLRLIQNVSQPKCFHSNGRQLSSLMASNGMIVSKQKIYHPKTIQIRQFSSEDLEKEFQTAMANSQKINVDVDNGTKLKMYALFKQGSIGPCNTEKPSMFSPVDKAKWQAWKALGDLPQDDAKKQYIEIIKGLLKESDKQGPKEPELIFEEKDQVYWIRLNRPKQYNAITADMYQGISDALKRAAEDPAIKFTVMTGTGPFYSSGNDLKNFTLAVQHFDGDMPKAMQAMRDQLQIFVSTFIDFPKPLIGVINGPCFGIMFTLLGLFDTIIATDKTYFICPFSSLGQSPEGCSTYTFPRIFGNSLASELLYFNYKMPVEEAHRLGFVSRIVPSDQLESHVNDWLYSEKGLVKTCYPNSMFNAKAMVRNEDARIMLHQINKVECDILQQSWASEECAEALQKFYSRK